MITIEQLDNPTQLKDLEYICELARCFLEDSGGTWPQRIEYYRSVLNKRIAEVEKMSSTQELSQKLSQTL